MEVYQDELGGWIVFIEDTKYHFESQSEAQMALRSEEYINAVKEANKKIWDGINDLVELQKEWNALDYSTTLEDVTRVLTSAEIGAVVFDTANAFVAIQNAGHATNMAKLL